MNVPLGISTSFIPMLLVIVFIPLSGEITCEVLCDSEEIPAWLVSDDPFQEMTNGRATRQSIKDRMISPRTRKKTSDDKINPLAYTMRVPSVHLGSFNFPLSCSYFPSASGD